MRKILTGLIVLAVAFSGAAYSQVQVYNYTFVKAFPDTSFKGSSGGHGVAVDPDGKVWIQLFSTSDSILTAPGTYKKTRVIYCFNRNGTPASFSPIKTVTVAGVTDTLFNSNRGMRADQQGNILFSSFDVLYRLNYKTGAGMNKVAPQAGNTLTAPVVDSLGEIFVGKVLDRTGPLQIYDKNFSFLGNVKDTTDGFSRTLGVSKNGNDVFWCGYTNYAVYKYHSDLGSLGPYSKVDTLMKGLAVESIEWHPKTGYLWVSSGSNFTPAKAPFSSFTWYAFAPPNYTTPVDSFKWNGSTANDPRPRGIAFSPTGDTVYVCQFNDGGSPPVEMFVKRSVVSVEQVHNSIPSGYNLEQNYPNPFNPSTEIKFTLEQAGMTTLKVYDLLGKEVATLVSSVLSAGEYKVTFDASNLSSGTYIYVLTTGGHRLSNKMMLLK